jgi:hypothetical protein
MSSYASSGTSFIDTINDKASDELKYINHIMRQGLVQFIALDYTILKAVRSLRQDFPSIDKPYLLGNGNGNSEFSIGLPMLASLELDSLFIPTPPLLPSQKHPDEITRFKYLSRILYRINARKFEWIRNNTDQQGNRLDENWILNNATLQIDSPTYIKIVSPPSPGNNT